MSGERNRQVAREFLDHLSKKADPGEVALLFSPDVHFEIAGDVGALPWIGRNTGRAAVVQFVRDTRVLIEQLTFDVQDISTSSDKAVIVGELVTRVNATGKTIDSAFAIILTISGNGDIRRFQMLEDSFAVSRAARP